jgi:hypothetical protein
MLPLQHLFAPNALVAESFRYKQTRVVSRRRPELGLRRITAKDCNLQPPCLAGSRPKVLRATYYALETKHYVLPLSSFCTTCAHGWFCTACAYCLVAWYVLAAIWWWCNQALWAWGLSELSELPELPDAAGRCMRMVQSVFLRMAAFSMLVF